jgi:Tfp pilus assembly protein PilX
MTMIRQMVRRVNSARRGGTGSDQGIAMLIVIMAMLVLSSLSLLALSAIVVQAEPTQFQKKNVQTINAAEAGLDAGLAAIRNGTYVEGTTTYGDRAQLPCWNGYTGQVGAPDGTNLTYSVTIQYFKSDPSEQTAAWRTANAMACTTGIGTSTTPTHAFLTSAGTGAALTNQPAAAGNRTLQSVYTFSSTNPNLPGGLIKDSSGLCYAGSATIGNPVTMQTCLTGADTQMWAYTSDYLLVLTSTRAADGTGGLCLAAVIGSASSVGATMRSCDTSGTDYTQKWGVSNSDPVQFFGHLKASYSTQWCLGVTSPGTVGGAVSATTSTCTGVYPTAQVGAGAAGTTLKTPAEVSGQPFQWVNYQEFGRCLDVTSWVVTTVSQILYPCKQDPMAAAILAATPGWNEVFVWDATSKHFWTNKDASSKPYLATNPAYCMKSQNTEGGYVLFGTLCTSITASADPAYTWTVNRDTGDSKTSYTIVDSYGRCLAAGPKNASNASAYSSVVTATCNGGGGQKWNAPANLGTALIGDTAEVANH